MTCAAAQLCSPSVRHIQLVAARRATGLLGGGALRAHAVATLGPDGLPFQAVVCLKEQPTPRCYPRSAGAPKMAPL